MERGLLWLPLLILFGWLTWAGWNEYQKIEAYRQWAQAFERSKYDIYAVLGQKNLEITWGKPGRDRPRELQTFSLTQVNSIRLFEPQSRQEAAIEFSFLNPEKVVIIPFTEVSLAQEWTEYLENLRNHGQ
ncbi:hypothetical protein [Gloeocapsa sp. PCC 73106]|uniref:hypothetical protein n=1 Tax=Gloeocapsa sp. PCC 73106 TaxID=102232 RepID=UPI0002AC98A2|nr:hypothetical protein [Gloeocapsa sp. PCC 73106]ELR98344.1 hypothetical protein GLO73106DRAFT_00021730 [Gloeocapsa sp. PCC 73106]